MRRRGFTLVELLVVISIMSLLMGLIVPVLARARQMGKGIFCLNNLRQMMTAANIYVDNNDGFFPPAVMTKMTSDRYIQREWDFEKVMVNGVVSEINPGSLWSGMSINSEIQQCPSFYGSSNSKGDKFTGYNYNSSYIGGIESSWSSVNSANINQIKRTSSCAVFGDGQWAGGANKYMRSPFCGKLDKGQESLRLGGTQGFRHLGATNVAWADGSVSVVKQRHTNTYETYRSRIVEETGFLSEDNKAYRPE